MLLQCQKHEITMRALLTDIICKTLTLYAQAKSHVEADQAVANLTLNPI